MIRKILNLKSGTAITRRYNNAKKIRTFSAANTVIACSLGLHHAKNSSYITFLDMANLIFFGKVTESQHAIIKSLKPEYKQIVNRAKSIFANKK